MTALRLDHLPGPPADAGFAHGRALRDLLEPAFLDAYFARIGQAIRVTREDITQQAARWLPGLPVQYQQEIEGMAVGAGVPTATAAEFLYADIARSSDTAAPVGPMCSSIISALPEEHTATNAIWIARNCDWLTPTLMRGCAAVVHETPHRIPVMAVGIRGDIDIDTGLNAEGLWLHLHTLHAKDDPPADRTCISWLFWAREALETCATLDELERFIQATGRDRGVFAIAGEGPTDRAAVFECTRATHTRHDIDPAQPACVTNHSLSRRDERPSDTPRAPGLPGGTLTRYRALRGRLDERTPTQGPDDLMHLLAAPDVEMRTATWLRTIYSAVVRPRDASIWFASGHHDGAPAASTGAWTRVAPPWRRNAAMSNGVERA